MFLKRAKQRIHEMRYWLLAALQPESPKRIPDKRDTAARGRVGEQAAKRFLKRLGYRIVVCNWRAQNHEIDLICRDGSCLVFVEVRTRNQEALVSGYHSITQRKKRALRQVCRNYLHQLQSRPKSFRLDIVEVRLCHSRGIRLKHYKNIQLFP